MPKYINRYICLKRMGHDEDDYVDVVVVDDVEDDDDDNDNDNVHNDDGL